MTITQALDRASDRARRWEEASQRDEAILADSKWMPADTVAQKHGVSVSFVERLNRVRQ